MKKVFVVLAILGLLIPGWAIARGMSPIPIMRATDYVQAGGTSVFVIYTLGTDIENAEAYTLQLSGVTPLYAPYSGASISVKHASMDRLPTGFSENDLGRNLVDGTSITDDLVWVTAIKDIASDSGATEIPYSFIPDPGAYLLIMADNSSGATDIQTGLILGLHRGTGWFEPQAFQVCSGVSSHFATSGVTAFTDLVNATTGVTVYNSRVVSIVPQGDNVHWTSDGTTPTAVCPEIAEGKEGLFYMEEAKRIKFTSGGSAGMWLNLNFYNTWPTR